MIKRMDRIYIRILIISIFIFFNFAGVAFGWVDGTPYFFERFSTWIQSLESQSSWIIEQPRPAPARANAPKLVVGEKKKFYAVDFRNHTQYIVDATLRVVGKFCYIFVEDSQWQRTVTPLAVEKIRRAFDESTPADANRGIYQIETAVFGNPPDIDNNPRIYILLLDVRDFYNSRGDYVAGYFSPVNQQHGVIRDPNSGVSFHSNEIELLYIDTHPLQAETPEGIGVVAHEFQHLIHWNNDPNEDIWVNEGCSDYAMFLCGYSVDVHLRPFEREPDTSLINWPAGMQSQLAHYGAAYLWMLYLHEHYGGVRTIANLVRNPANSIASINSTLKSMGYTKSFSQIFSDWKIANYIDDINLDNGIYGYQYANPRVTAEPRSYPIDSTNNHVNAWAADYILVSNRILFGSLRVNFLSNPAYHYDVKMIEYRYGKPSAVRDMRLNASGIGQLTVSNYGTEVNQIVIVPSLQPASNVSGNIAATYSYSAKLAVKVTFQTDVIPNPIHPKHWDIIAKVSDNIGADAPVITITKNGQALHTNVPMTAIADGEVYSFQLYLPPNIQPDSIAWQIFYLNEKVGEGTLN